MQACRLNGIDRYVMVSSMGADPEAPDDGGFNTYLRAKGQADQKLAESGLPYTIVRPGRLTDDPGTGHVTAAEHTAPGRSRATTSPRRSRSCSPSRAPPA